jgi:hypothetical protein
MLQVNLSGTSWRVLLGVGVLVLCGLIVWSAYGLRQVCETGKSAIEESPIFMADLGSPIEIQCRWWECVISESGIADLSFDVKGPRGEGKIEMRLVRKQSLWQLESASIAPLSPSNWTEGKFLLALGHSGVGLILYTLTILFSRQFATHQKLSTLKWTFEAVFFNVIVLAYIAWKSKAEDEIFRSRALWLLSGSLVWISVSIFLVYVDMI